jgi:CheY-like chemotaxis protein
MASGGGVEHIRVLIVDDEPSVADFVARVLGDAGYNLAVAPDAPTALAIAETSPAFDLLLTDVRMPDMSGVELAQRMRARDPDLTVLYLTGYSDALFDERDALWEGEAFLEKPCSAKALLEAVSLVLFGRIERPGESRRSSP